MMKGNYIINVVRSGLFAVVPAMLLLHPYSLLAQENLNFKDFDKNNDGKINHSEFHEVFIKNYWDDWNKVDNAGLDDEDFYTYTYRVIDRNRDKRLNAYEWNIGKNYFGKYIRDDYIAYDINGDNYISAEEFTGSIKPSGYFNEWDINRDGYLTGDELAEKVFDVYDKNNDKLINKKEYINFDLDYKDI